MDDKESSTEALWMRLLRGEEKQDKVDLLLAQFHEENALQLKLDSHTLKSSLNLPSKDLGGFDYAGIDQQLAMRYAKLKAPPSKPRSKETIHSSENGDPGKDSNNSEGEIKGGVGESARVLTDEEEERILGQNLAARFAALKTSSPVSAQVPGVGGLDSQETQLGFQGDEACCEEEQVRRLLASVQDSLRLGKSGVRDSDAEGEISDSEVVKVVEWAKDAARLEQQDDDEEEEEEKEETESDEDEGRGRKKRSHRK